MTNFVLVHGSYQGGWIWQKVADRLRAAGHRVYHPSLDGCADRKGSLRPGITTESHADEIANLLFYEDLKDVVLVGTSSGGMVVCRVAELMRERVGRLALVDALALLNGEKIGDIVTRSTSVAVAGGLTRGPTPETSFPDLGPEIRPWAVERYAPHPIGIYEHPVRLDSFWAQQWPGSLVVWCRRAQNPGEVHQRRAAERLHAKWAELDTGHYPMLSMPEELTQLLVAG
jgi:pimeloyl-ACP methyl ester carboxylesterase